MCIFPKQNEIIKSNFTHLTTQQFSLSRTISQTLTTHISQNIPKYVNSTNVMYKIIDKRSKSIGELCRTSYIDKKVNIYKLLM